MRDSRILQVSLEGLSRSAAFNIKQKVLMTYSSPESATPHGVYGDRNLSPFLSRKSDRFLSFAQIQKFNTNLWINDKPAIMDLSIYET